MSTFNDWENAKMDYAAHASKIFDSIKQCLAQPHPAFYDAFQLLNKATDYHTYQLWNAATKRYHTMLILVQSHRLIEGVPLVLVHASDVDETDMTMTLFVELLNRFCFNTLGEVYVGVSASKAIPNVKLVQVEDHELQPFVEADVKVFPNYSYDTPYDKQCYHIFKSWLSKPDASTQKESNMQTKTKTKQAKSPLTLSFQLSQYNLAEQGFVAKKPSVMIEPLNEWWALMHPSILKAVTHEFPDTLYAVDAHHDNRKVFMSSCRLRSRPCKKIFELYFAFDPIVQELNLFGDYEADYEVTWDFILKKLKSVPELNGMVIELTVTKDVSPYVLQKLVEMSEVRCSGSTGFRPSNSVSDTYSYQFTLKA